MAEILKKPYEISVWEDRLVTPEVKEGEEPKDSYYKEIKLAVIGSDKMTSPNRVFNPVLTENINGEVTLTFSLAYTYFDPLTEEMVNNPFTRYLINERKVKLFYDDKWYDFVIKECDENSDDYIFNYTARDLFTLELSKVGYGITFDTELMNNQGTVTELGQKAVESVDWEIDVEDSDLLQQTIKEPLYQFKVDSDFTALNLDTNEEVTIEANETLLVFYSYIENKETKFVQFIRPKDYSARASEDYDGRIRPEVIIKDGYTTDDNGVIIGTNYRILEEVEYSEDEQGDVDFSLNGVNFNNEGIYNDHQGYRLVYSQQTVYDPVMKRTVDVYETEYKDKKQYIYHYTDYEYSTSEVIKSYITNGTDFSIIQGEAVPQGWATNTKTSDFDEGGRYKLQSMKLVTYPEIKIGRPLSTLGDIAEIRSYLQLKFAGTLTNDYENTYFNSGFGDSINLIDHITAGETYAFRIRAACADTEHGELNQLTTGRIRALVGKYSTVEDTYIDESGQEVHSYIRKILPNGILFNFNNPNDWEESNNYINGGTFTEDMSNYLIDGVIQVPSSKYIYTTEGDTTDYIWDVANKRFIEKNNSYINYYVTTAKAEYSISNTSLRDGSANYGIFLYLDGEEGAEDKYYYVEDVQLTRCVRDGEGKVVTEGNIPTAASLETDYYYLKPDTNVSADEVNIFSTLDYLRFEVGLGDAEIKPLYNENCEKVLSITESQSNVFNILQTLCETFECWLKLSVKHNPDGSLWLDADGAPSKKVSFKEYVGKDNFAGFRYGINLNTINRNVASDEFVTKLLVDPVQSDYVDGGTLSIQNAKSNPSNESYILNFSYYINKGLIQNERECNEDLNNFYAQLREVNTQIQQKESERILLENTLVSLRSKRTVYTGLIEEARDSYAQSLIDFEKIVGITYSEYVEKFENEEDPDDTWEKLKNNEDVTEIIGKIYAASAAMNNYGGLLSNLNREYASLYLNCYGAREYGITVTTTPTAAASVEGAPNTTKIVVDEYIDGFSFYVYKTDGSREEFNSSANERFFTATTAADTTPYQYLMITQVPKDYEVYYYSNNKAYPVRNVDDTLFKIYMDEDAESIAVKRYKLVPTEEYAESHIGYQKEIEQLYERKAEIEKVFYKKYSRFIQEGTWTSNNYIDPELYYLDALQVSKNYSQPKVSYDISVSEVSELEGLSNYFFTVGDKTYIEDPNFFGYLTVIVDNGIVYKQTEDTSFNPDKVYYEKNELDDTYFITQDSSYIQGKTYYEKIVTTTEVKTPLKEEVIITEVEWHLDSPEDNSITIQNFKTRFEDLFQRLSAMVQSAEYIQGSYARTASILDSTGLIDTSLLLDSLNSASGRGYALTSNGTISTDDEGIMIQDLTNGANRVKIVSRGIKISTDGGESWQNVIDAYGIHTDALTAGTIDTQTIRVMDGANPSFRWDKNGISAYGLNKDGTEGYDLNTYVRFDKYGVYGIKDDADYVANSLSDVKNKADFGLTWDGFFIKNRYTNGYVSISSDNDFQIVQNIDGDEVERIKIGALDPTADEINYGIVIKDKQGNPTFETDEDGNLTVTGTVHATDGSFTGTVYATDGEFTGTIHANDGEFTGYINAKGGNFSGDVRVGDQEQNIVIVANDDKPYIASSDYVQNPQTGWIIDGNGDAVFNNVSIRGAINTSVFQYAEIQAVGGAFLFRPSDSINDAELMINERTLEGSVELTENNTYAIVYLPSGVKSATITLESEGSAVAQIYRYGAAAADETFIPAYKITGDLGTINYTIDYEVIDLLLKVENVNLFREQEWCRLDNNMDTIEEGKITGLSSVFKVIKIYNSNSQILLEGAGARYYKNLEGVEGNGE